MNALLFGDTPQLPPATDLHCKTVRLIPGRVTTTNPQHITTLVQAIVREVLNDNPCPLFLGTRAQRRQPRTDFMPDMTTGQMHVALAIAELLEGAEEGLIVSGPSNSTSKPYDLAYAIQVYVGWLRNEDGFADLVVGPDVSQALFL